MRRRLKYVPPALLATAVAEVAVFVLVARQVGVAVAVLLVLAACAAGVLLLRREGVRAWRSFRASTETGQAPGGEASYGVVGLGAGVLLAVPGLVTALAGVFLLLPPVRRWAAGWLRRVAENRLSTVLAGDLFGPRRVKVRQGPPRAHRSDDEAATGAALEGEIIPPR